jgi:phytol kinase
MSKLTFEIKRKIFHVAMLAYLFGYILIAMLTGSKLIGILALSSVLILFLIMEYFRIYKGAKVPMFYSLWRDSEKRKAGSEIYYMLGVVICLILFEPIIALTSILMATFGDTVAALFGIAFGKTRIKSKKKVTVVGSFAELITNLIIGFVMLGNWMIAVPMALVATATETYSHSIDDNLTTPVFAGFIGSLMKIFPFS